MSDPGFNLLAGVGLLCALAGALITYLIAGRRISELKNDNTRLAVQLEAGEKTAQAQALALEEARKHMSDTFGAMAGEALKHNSAEFLKLAQENLKQFQTRAESQLSEKEKAVENLVKPIHEAIEKTEKQIRQMEKERHAAFGSLNQNLQHIADTNRLLQGETRNLVQALRRPEVRGQWGEMTLKRLAELAGMVEHCDFAEQQQVRTEDGLQRPDMIVRMPDGREIIVDAKTPLDAYLSAVEAGTDEDRAQALKRHARNVRTRVQELSAKAYWQSFDKAPDFVVLFVPGDQFLTAALELDAKLLEDALQNKVVLSTPTSFVALLRAVAYGWRQESLAENAEEIRKLGSELYDRLTVFADHLARVGSNLNKSVAAFNKAVGSFDTRILPGAKKFVDMGVSGKKTLAGPDQIEQGTRRVEAAETDQDPPENTQH